MKLILNTVYGQITCNYNKPSDEDFLIKITFSDNKTTNFYISDFRKTTDLILNCLSADNFTINYRENLIIHLKNEEIRKEDYIDTVRYLYINDYKIHCDTFIRDIDLLYSILDSDYEFDALTLNCGLIK